MSRRVLVLAGTAEARTLCAALAERADLAPIASLAGVTEQPERYAGETRVGGFGGAECLAAYLRAERIAALVDATHPFAARITANAVAATSRAGVPYLRLERPSWRPEAGDDWRDVADLCEAAAALPSGARAFLAIGSAGLDAFARREDVWFLARMIEPPPHPPFTRGEVLAQRPPYRRETDLALLREHAISHVVAKNAGGEAGRAKLLAAREIGLPVILVARPAVAAEPSVADVEGAVAWLGATLSESNAPCA